MNKKVEKTLVAALSAAMGAGLVAPVVQAAESNNLNALYKAAYDAAVKAQTSKTQKDLTEARTALDAFMKVVPKELRSLGQTLSSMLDKVQQPLLVNTIKAIEAAQKSAKQADIDVARAFIADMPTVWKRSYSAALDKVQNTAIANVRALVAKAVASGTQADFDAAKAAYAELLTMQDATVKAWVESVVKAELDKVVVTAKVDSVTAVDAKTLQVKFDKALTAEELGKLTYEVKLAGNVATFKAVADTSTTVKLVRVSGLALEAGDYEVTVKGLGTTATVKTLKVEAQKVSVATVTTSNLLDDTAKSVVGLQFKDQYGTEVKVSDTEITASGYNVTQGAYVSVTWDSGLKSYIIDTKTTAAQFKTDDVVRVSFVHAQSGTSVVKELKVVNGAVLSGATFGEVQLPTGKTVLTQNLTNVKVPYTAVDQYDGALELDKTSSTGNVVVVSSNDNIVNPSNVTFIKEGTPSVTKMNIASFGATGKVTITVVNKTTGATYNVNLDVKENAGVISTVELEKSQVDIADGTNLTAAVGLTVKDNYGTAIEAKNYAGASGFTITSSNDSIATAAINNTSSSDDYGKLVITEKGTRGQRATITITVNSTGATARLNVIIGEAVVPASIDFDKDSTHKTSLAIGAQTTVTYSVADQYGNAVTTNDSNYKVVYEIKDSSDLITVDSLTDDTDETSAEAVITAAKAGTATLIAKLIKGTDEVIATKELPLTIVENSGANLTYSVAAIPTLYKDGGTSISAAKSAGYAKEVKLEAKDASGNVVSIPGSSIVSVVSSDANVLVGLDTGKWYVASNGAATTEDVKATITVLYNAKDGVKSLTKEVTVSKDDLRAAKVLIQDKANTATDAEAITNVEVANLTALDSYASAYVVVEDQFGVKHTAIADDSTPSPSTDFKEITARVLNVVGLVDATTTDVVTVSTGKLDFNNFAGDTVTGGTASTFRVIVMTQNGVANTVEVKSAN